MSPEKPRGGDGRAPANDITAERAALRDNAAFVDIGETGDAREFLLAERPRLVRATLYLSLLLMAALLGWSCIGRMDIVVSAPGVVRPRGDVVQVQAPVGGVVTDVLAKEGEPVSADQVILRFDPKPLRLERDRVAARIEAKRREKADAEQNRKRLGLSYEAERATSETAVEQARLQVELEKTRRDNQVKQAKAQLEIAQARVEAIRARIAQQEKTVAAATERYRGNALTKVELEREEQSLAGLRSELSPELKAVEKAHLDTVADETQVKLSEAQLAQRFKLRDELAPKFAIQDGDAQARVSQIEAEIIALENEREQVDLRLQRAEVRAPVGGFVTQLAVTHPGRVVAEGSTIAHLSPSGRELVLEAYVRNNDRREIRPGVPCKLRFAAFPYQEYGALEGKVAEVSLDAMKANEGPTAANPEGLVYKVTVALLATELVNNRGKGGKVQLGMAAQCDIVVDERPLIFIVLNELKEFFDFRRT